jgi:hypothetical protein
MYYLVHVAPLFVIPMPHMHISCSGECDQCESVNNLVHIAPAVRKNTHVDVTHCTLLHHAPLRCTEPDLQFLLNVASVIQCTTWCMHVHISYVVACGQCDSVYNLVHIAPVVLTTHMLVSHVHIIALCMWRVWISALLWWTVSTKSRED